MDLKKPLAFVGSLAVVAAAIAGLSTLASASEDNAERRVGTEQSISSVDPSMRAQAAAEAANFGNASTSNGVGVMSASGCTWAPHGYVCGGVKGVGLRVTSANVVRGKKGTEFICDYYGTVRVYNSKGTQIYLKKSGRHQGCTPLRAWFNFSVNKNFPNNSKLCTSFYERGVRQGTTCFKIHK